MERLRAYEALLRVEANKQNLVSRSSLVDLKARHLDDSLQLAALIDPWESVVDIGSGAGLPGVVLACAGIRSVTLVEPRRLRADFLRRAVAALGLSASVFEGKAERVRGCFDVITGRAVAELDRFLGMTRHLAHEQTRWILPKGRSAQIELAQARRNWHCRVERVPSRTDPAASILVVRELRARRGE